MLKHIIHKVDICSANIKNLMLKLLKYCEPLNLYFSNRHFEQIENNKKMNISAKSCNILRDSIFYNFRTLYK